MSYFLLTSCSWAPIQRVLYTNGLPPHLGARMAVWRFGDVLNRLAET